MNAMPLVLRLNAASCLIFGSLGLLWPGPAADLLGTFPQDSLRLLCCALLFNGCHLLWASQRPEVAEAEVIWFSIGDLGWWLASLGLVATQTWITSGPGIFLTLITAFCVAGLGTLQLWLIGQRRHNLSSTDLAQSIGATWLALPRWVKLWLVALNAIFLAAPAMTERDIWGPILIAYVASGPLLIGLAAYQGGLTKLAGLGHLIPWLPLLAWLTAQLAMPKPAVVNGYLVLLTAAVAVCLTFDAHDLFRWVRGERDLIGARKQVQRPASRAA